MLSSTVIEGCCQNDFVPMKMCSQDTRPLPHGTTSRKTRADAIQRGSRGIKWVFLAFPQDCASCVGRRQPLGHEIYR